MAATNTGAYFTDSEAGSLSGKTGHLDIAANNDFNLNFNNLVPGEYQDRVIKYHTDSNTPEDIWLKIPDGVAYAQFSGAKNGQSRRQRRPGSLRALRGQEQRRQPALQLVQPREPERLHQWLRRRQRSRLRPQATAQDDFPPNCGVPHYMLIDSERAHRR